MKTVYTKNAPEPIGPYSQAVLADNILFVSGQIALKDGELQNESIETETKQVLCNLEAILKQASFSVEDIAKVTIYLTDIQLFSKVNKIYEEFLKGHKPARETVEVSALPLGAKIEISLIAVKNNSTESKED